jgi:hypothetical protein
METRNRALCEEFARILGGTSSFQNNSCISVVSRNIQVRIMGRLSPTASSGFFAFNSLDINGTALNLGEFPLLEKEVNPFINILRKQGIEVSPVKSHWLFIEPQIIFINFQSIDNPLTFARKVRNALKVMTR